MGHPDENSMVRDALEQFPQAIAQEELATSADLYAEVYSADEDLQSMTAQAIEGWPD